MRYPPGTPAWMQQDLEALSGAGKLHGVPGPILSAICYFTSAWGLTGLGVNPQGFGGYFGIHETWTYYGMLFTAAQLRTANTFKTQAICSAMTLASYNLPLSHALAMYATGTSNNVTTGFVRYVLTATQAPATYIFGLPITGVDIMAVSIGTGFIAVTGINKNNHKIVASVPLGERADATKWSYMDVTDMMIQQKANPVTATFVS